MSSGTRSSRWAIGIGARLTLWGAALTTLLIAGVCAALYAGMYFSMRAQIDSFLEGEINEFLLTVAHHGGDDAALEADIRHELGARTRHDLGFRLMDEQGHIFVSSAVEDKLRGLWTPPPGWNASGSTVRCETLHSAIAPYPYRVCSLPTQTPDGRACTAQCSYLLDQMNESLARFRRICVAIVVVAPILALGVGGFLSRRSLEPIRQIMRRARKMNARDLRSRLPLSGTGDEMDQLTETLNGLLDRVERRVQELQRFTADASHELRTPLTALRGSAEVMLSRPRSAEELRQLVEESLAQYERLQRIAEDLLLLARLDSGEAVMRRDAFTLESAVADVVDLYAPTAEEKGLTLEWAKNGTFPMIGDDGRIRQVVGNILDNAIKYTPAPGQIRVTIHGTNGEVILRIQDTGVGIPTEHLPRVFDRFYRVDSSRSALHTSGTGLGLAICRSIVEAHGGRIDLESQLGQGTSATVVLPVRSAPHPVERGFE